MTGALASIRVVDAGEGVAAGYCTRLLAGLGADVVKVERPGLGDSLRRAGPFPGDSPNLETSAVHLHLNAAKRSITLDVTTATGAAILRDLLHTADVLVTHVRPHPSLAPQRLASALPRGIIVDFIGGAEASSGALPEIVAMARGGYLGLNGDPDRAPVKVWGEQAHYQAGLHAALGVMTALRAASAAARPDGEPERVAVSVVEAAGFLTAGALQRWRLTGRPQVRAGPRPAGFAANRLYPSTVRPCADGHVHVHCHNRHHELISLLMEDPALRAPEVLAQPLGHADEIDAHMDRWLAPRTRAEAVAAAQELRVPMTEVFSPAEVLADADGYHRVRGALVEVEHPLAGRLRQPGAPIRIEGAHWRVDRAPLLAEHNSQVLGEELGITVHELARLRAAGVI